MVVVPSTPVRYASQHQPSQGDWRRYPRITLALHRLMRKGMSRLVRSLGQYEKVTDSRRRSRHPDCGLESRRAEGRWRTALEGKHAVCEYERSNLDEESCCVEVELIHGLNTSRPSPERDTHGTTNSPLPSVVTVRSSPVPRFFVVTVAPGIAAPESSLAVPKMVPVLLCAFTAPPPGAPKPKEAEAQTIPASLSPK